MKFAYSARAAMAAGLLLLAAVPSARATDDRFKGGGRDGWARETVPGRLDGGGPLVSLSSAFGQTFDWTAPDTVLAPLTIRAWDVQGVLTNGSVLRLSVPATWQCRFKLSAALTLAGSASGKVGAVELSEDGYTLLIPVTADFDDGDVLTVSGLILTALPLVREGAEWLTLAVPSADGGADAVFQDWNPVAASVPRRGGARDGWASAQSDYSVFHIPRGTTFILR